MKHTFRADRSTRSGPPQSRMLASSMAHRQEIITIGRRQPA
jgi:hypothetical protein